MGRKARLKRERRAHDDGHRMGERRLIEEIHRRLASRGAATMVVSPPGQPKLSDALLDLVQPFVDALGRESLTKERMQALLMIATLVWNAEHLMAGSHLLADALRLTDQQGIDPELTRHLIDVLVERRRLHFPEDPRIVADVTVSEGGEPGSFQVSAAYVLRPRVT